MIELSNGNKKIGKDTFIFNITPAKDCPSAKKGLCGHASKCYALKAEKQYPACYPFRKRQAKYWQNTPYETIALDIDKAINKKRKPIKYLRLNESGDFKSQSDINKLKHIAGLLKIFQPELKIYTYSARQDLYFDDLPENVTVNGSGFMVHNEFKAVHEYTGKALKCAGDCKTCGICKTRHGNKTEVLFH
ncbi:MAG: GP88 family protein [Promethearchaeota archaeon]|jgi:hypothetical protein